MSSSFKLEDYDGNTLEIVAPQGFAHPLVKVHGHSFYLHPNHRRALLSHLLEAEGLPGVEEIDELANAYPQLEREHEALKECVSAALGINFDPNYGYDIEGDRNELLYPTLNASVVAAVASSQQEAKDSGFCEGYSGGYDDGHDEGYEEGYAQGLNDGPEPDDTALAKIRQSRLHELLEAEARERVEAWVDDDGDFCARIDDYYYVTLDEDGDIHFPCVVADPDDRLIYGIFAALAEKRRREESEVNNG